MSHSQSTDAALDLTTLLHLVNTMRLQLRHVENQSRVDKHELLHYSQQQSLEIHKLKQSLQALSQQQQLLYTSTHESTSSPPSLPPFTTVPTSHHSDAQFDSVVYAPPSGHYVPAQPPTSPLYILHQFGVSLAELWTSPEEGRGSPSNRVNNLVRSNLGLPLQSSPSWFEHKITPNSKSLWHFNLAVGPYASHPICFTTPAHLAHSDHHAALEQAAEHAYKEMRCHIELKNWFLKAPPSPTDPNPIQAVCNYIAHDRLAVEADYSVRVDRKYKCILRRPKSDGQPVAIGQGNTKEEANIDAHRNILQRLSDAYAWMVAHGVDEIESELKSLQGVNAVPQSELSQAPIDYRPHSPSPATISPAPSVISQFSNITRLPGVPSIEPGIASWHPFPSQDTSRTLSPTPSDLSSSSQFSYMSIPVVTPSTFFNSSQSSQSSYMLSNNSSISREVPSPYKQSSSFNSSSNTNFSEQSIRTLLFCHLPIFNFSNTTSNSNFLFALVRDKLSHFPSAKAKEPSPILTPDQLFKLKSEYNANGALTWQCKVEFPGIETNWTEWVTKKNLAIEKAATAGLELVKQHTEYKNVFLIALPHVRAPYDGVMNTFRDFCKGATCKLDNERKNGEWHCKLSVTYGDEQRSYDARHADPTQARNEACLKLLQKWHDEIEVVKKTPWQQLQQFQHILVAQK